MTGKTTYARATVNSEDLVIVEVHEGGVERPVSDTIERVIVGAWDSIRRDSDFDRIVETQCGIHIHREDQADYYEAQPDGQPAYLVIDGLVETRTD